jgi:hypothetical protein
MITVARASKRRRKAAAAAEPFRPSKRGYAPPGLCWDVVLASPAAAGVLSSLRWMWVLPQVARAFREALVPDQWAGWACAAEAVPPLWKAKANELLALTARDMARVPRAVVVSWGVWGWHEVHLMRPALLLRLALDKHGGTCAGINAAFLKRRDARARREARARLRGPGRI